MIDALIDSDFELRALVRDASSSAAQVLAGRGVRLIEGDFENAAIVAEAMREAFGVFSVQPAPGPQDPGAEIRAGAALVEAAQAAGVDTFVHTSVARAGEHERFEGWAERRWEPNYWISKASVNSAVKQAGFPHWTILKPAFMMDNFIPPKAAFMFPSLVEGRIDSAMPSGVKLDLIAASDVGRFAAAAFRNPDRFHGEEIDLAASSLTMGEVAEVIADVTGVAITARALTREAALAAGYHAGVVKSQEWAGVEGYRVDRKAALRREIPLEPFRQWAARHGRAFAVGK